MLFLIACCRDQEACIVEPWTVPWAWGPFFGAWEARGISSPDACQIELADCAGSRRISKIACGLHGQGLHMHKSLVDLPLHVRKSGTPWQSAQEIHISRNCRSILPDTATKRGASPCRQCLLCHRSKASLVAIMRIQAGALVPTLDEKE